MYYISNPIPPVPIEKPIPITHAPVFGLMLGCIRWCKRKTLHLGGLRKNLLFSSQDF